VRSWLRRLLAALVALPVAAAALLCWLPARWAWPWLAPRLHGVALEGVGGTVWDGHADVVRTPDGRALGRLDWRLSRRLLLGEAVADLALAGDGLEFAGHVRRAAPSTLDWRDVRLAVDLAAFAQPLPPLGGTPQGRFELALPHARLQGGWPLQLDGTARWREAVVVTPAGRVALGDFHADLRAEGGAVQARFADDGSGPLAAAGELRLIPLGWRATAGLRPRADDPALRRWLAGFGTAQADGSVRIERGGGLLRKD